MLISVIVPVYNTKEYLEECVKSILGQTYSCFELLLIDDGSTDGSQKICDVLAQSDARISVIHTENRGVSSARNTGIRSAKGEYILFVDSDDYIQEFFLEKAIEVCRRHECDIVSAGMLEEREGQIIKEYHVKETIIKQINALSQEDYCELLQNNYISSSCNKLISRSYIGETLFDENSSYGEDLRFVFSLLEKKGKIAAIPEAFYSYRRHGDSATRSFDEKKVECLVQTYVFLDDFSSKNSLNTFAEMIQHRWTVECAYAQRVILSSSAPFLVQYRRLRLLQDNKKLRKWALLHGGQELRSQIRRPGLYLLKRGIRNWGHRIANAFH